MPGVAEGSGRRAHTIGAPDPLKVLCLKVLTGGGRSPGRGRGSRVARSSLSACASTQSETPLITLILHHAAQATTYMRSARPSL